MYVFVYKMYNIVRLGQSRLFTDRTPYNTIDFKRSKQKDGIALPYIDNNIINNKIITTNNKKKKQNNISNTLDYKIDYTKNHNNKPKQKTISLL